MANAKIWEQRIAAWRASGLTAAQYCAKEGLGRPALSRWSQRLQREPPPMRLARLVRTPEPAPTERPRALDDLLDGIDLDAAVPARRRPTTH